MIAPPVDWKSWAGAHGELPKRPKGSDCNSAVIDFGGSNPSLATERLKGSAKRGPSVISRSMPRHPSTPFHLSARAWGLRARMGVRGRPAESGDHNDCARAPSGGDIGIEAHPHRAVGRDRSAHRRRARVRGVGARRVRQRHRRAGVPHDRPPGGLRGHRAARCTARAEAPSVVRAREHGVVGAGPADRRGPHLAARRPIGTTTTAATAGSCRSC